MRTTIELPDKLLARAKSRAALEGISLKDFFIVALEQKLAPPPKKARKPPPLISTGGPPVPDLTREQVDAVLFGFFDDALPGRR
jgi:hypothetical protein